MTESDRDAQFQRVQDTMSTLIDSNADLNESIQERNALVAAQAKDLAEVKEMLPNLISKKTYLRTVAAGLVIIALLCVGMVSGLVIMTQGRDQARYNASLVRILVAVTGCSTEDTPEACSQKQKDRATEEGKQRVAAVGCLIHRAIEGKPPLLPGEACQ